LTPNADQLVQEGLAHHQAGEFVQANDAYQEALKADPNHPDALHLLGMIAHQIGNQTLAAELINLAIQVKPDSPNYFCNLGSVLQAEGRFDEAIAHFRHATSLQINNALLHYNLAFALQSQGQLQEAADSYRKALLLSPDHIESLSNLGHTLRALNKPDQAIECYQKAIAIAPNRAEMHFNLGTALSTQGNFDAAINSYRQAIELSPDYAQAHCNLGAALLATKNPDAAIASYQRAILANPNFADAHYNLGIVLSAQNKFDASISSFRRTLALQPKFVECYCNLGNALRASGHLEDAVDCYQKALEIKPDYANAYSNLLFLESYHATISPVEYLKHARGWEQACVPAKDRQSSADKIFSRLPLNGRRLKIGYVSGDFRKHAASYFIEQIFAKHNHSLIEVFAYSNNRSCDEVTERLKGLVDHWIDIVSMSDIEVCQRMEADKIDILIDLSAHSAHNRLGVFARRAAPVQATYLYFASTGLTEMDYWIGDEILTPPDFNNHFSEKVWRLPRVWLSYKPLTAAPLPHWQPSSDGTIWLGSFNNLGKITPLTLSLWARILHALPEGRLLLKNKELADDSNRQRILSELAALGIDAQRIDLQPGTDWEDYMSQHDRLDIALDPIGGHGGGTSTCDALWMGVPVVHLLGDHVGSRFAASLINAIGHCEWIAYSETEYVEKVIALAKNIGLRKQLRFAQRDAMARSPLCDALGLAGALEAAYSTMFKVWQDSQLNQ
jgi:predicted O-linked N-acetylglucosamine transferase (SPINDLY family)